MEGQGEQQQQQQQQQQEQLQQLRQQIVDEKSAISMLREQFQRETDVDRRKEGFAAREDGFAAASHGLGATLVEKRYAFTLLPPRACTPSFVAKHARANVHELRLPS